MRRSFGFQQEEFSMQEESWSYESEQHYSQGSSMQMMPRLCPPKQSNHGGMFLQGSQQQHQGGWHGSNGGYGHFNHDSGGKKNKPDSFCMNETQFLENGMFHNSSSMGAEFGHFNHASGGKKKPVSSCINEAQFLGNGMFHNRSSMGAEFGHFNHASGGKKKPVSSCMNENQFLENGMFHNAEVRTGAFGMVHTPAKAMVVEEMQYEHSKWGGTNAGHCQSFDNNFNWRFNGCRTF